MKLDVRVKIFISVWLVYLVFVYTKPESISSNLVDMAMSIVDKGNLFLRYSVNTVDVAIYNGSYVTTHFPGGSVPIVILYFLCRPLMAGLEGYSRFLALNGLSVVFIASVYGALTCVVFYSILDRLDLSAQNKLILTFLLAFGTMLFGYSTAIYKLNQATLYLFLAFFLLFRMRTSGEHKKSHYFWTGFFLMGAVSCHPIVVHISAVLLVYAIFVGGIRRLPYLCAGAVLPLVMILLYLNYGFGSVLANPYAYKVNADPNVLTFPNIINILDLFLGVEEGLFIYTPIMFISIWGLVSGLSKKQYLPEMVIIGFIFILSGVAAASFFSRFSTYRDIWPHEEHIAIRYLLPLCPFLMLPIALVIDRAKRVIVYILGGISVFFAYLGAQAGIFPTRGWQLIYAIKVFISSFGMPTFFSQTLPAITGVDIFHTYVSRPDVRLTDLLAAGNRNLLLVLLCNQMIFFGAFVVVLLIIAVILTRLWKDKPERIYT
ncbi:MAG: hypothetical protein GF409_00105 [Candidatus Omnitrophica bacterium]|nr:hypothetical protein [Candidatus Omnitrophota bacterium]